MARLMCRASLPSPFRWWAAHPSNAIVLCCAPESLELIASCCISFQDPGEPLTLLAHHLQLGLTMLHPSATYPAAVTALKDYRASLRYSHGSRAEALRARVPTLSLL